MSGFDVNIPKDPIGVKGTDGVTKTSPSNPLDVQIAGGAGSGLATETTLAAVLAAVDGLELSIDNIDLDLDAINLNVDGLETLAAATNAALASLETANDLSGDDIVTAVDLVRTTLDATLATLQASSETHSDEVKAAVVSLEAAVTAFKTAFDSRDLATETTLATLLTEATFAAEDFATQTTLEAARALIDSLDTKFDVTLSTRASEATVATLLTEATFAAEDFATQTTLEAARVLLASLDAKDFATAANQVAAEAFLSSIDENSSFYLDQIFRASGMACERETLVLTLEALANDFGFGPSQPGIIGVANPVIPASPTLTFVLVGQLTSANGLVDIYSVSGDDGTHVVHFSECEKASTEATLAALRDRFSAGTRTISTQQPPSLTASQNWVAPWQLANQDGGVTVVLALIGGLSSASIEWSEDGISANGVTTTIKEQDAGGGVLIYVIQAPITYEYFRVNVTDAGAGSTMVISSVSIQKSPPAAPLYTIDTPIGAFDVAPLTRSIFTGEQVDGLLNPTGTFANVELINGSIKAAIPWELILKYATPTDPALPSGAAPAIHPTLNTEPNVIDTGWVPARAFPGGNFIHVLGNTGLTVYLANASDINGNNAQGLAAPSLVTVAGVPSEVSAAYFDDFFRAIIVNSSGSTATQLTVRTMGLQAPPPPVVLSVDQEIPPFIPAPVVQAISKGQGPNDLFRATRVQGRDDNNSTTTPLNGNTGGTDHIYRGNWFEWQDTYVSIVTEVESDVAGTFFLDFSNVPSPTDGDESSVKYSITEPYDPSVGVGVFRRHSPLQSRWVRCRYINGTTAQTSFAIDTAFTVTSAPDVMEPLASTPRDEYLVGHEKSFPFSKDETDVYAPIMRTGNSLRNHVTGIDAELPIRPLDTMRVGQGTATASNAVPIPSAGAGLASRKTVEFSNHSNTVNIYYGPNATVTTGTGKLLRPGADTVLEVSEAVDFYWIAQDAGGATSTSIEAGSTTGGTGTSTGNLLASDDTRANLAPAQTGEVGGFTYTKTLADINTLRIGVEARRSPALATQSVTHVETQSGTTAAATSVSSAPMAGGTDLLYIVSVARDGANTISGVSGGGLTYTQAVADVDTGGSRLDIWYAYGSPSLGAVTATMSSSKRATISASSYLGASPTATVQDAGTGVTGTSDSPVTATLNKTENGLFYMAAVHEGDTFTPGAGYTKRAEVNNGGIDLATQSKLVLATGTESAGMTLPVSKKWGAAGITITPAPAGDIEFLLEFDVNGGGYTNAGTLTFSTTTDATKYIDISGPHPLTEATINQTTIRATRTAAGVADGQIDYMFLEIGEGDTDTAVRISYAEVADSAYP